MSKLTPDLFLANLQVPRGQFAANLLRASAETGELFTLIPELEPMTTQMQNRHHQEGTVWEHTLRVISHTDGGSLRLRLAALLHDVGKPATATPHEKYPGEFRFIGHEDVGAALAYRVVRRLVSKDRLLAFDVCFLVQDHMRIHLIGEMKRHKVAKMLREGAWSQDLVALGYADAMGREPQLKEAAKRCRDIALHFMENDVLLQDLGFDFREFYKAEPNLSKARAKWEIMENLLTKDPTKTRAELLKAVGLGE